MNSQFAMYPEHAAEHVEVDVFWPEADTDI